MSSDRLDRKRRSPNDISDDSADELPPVKLRKSNSSSDSFGKVLTDKFKNILCWLAPNSLKNYMIDIVKGPFIPQARANTLDMSFENDVKVRMEDDDDDEIAVIGVQNGASGVQPRIIADQRHVSLSRNARHRNAAICPLASAQLGYSMLSHNTVLGTRTMPRRPMNGFYSKHEDDLEDTTKHKQNGSEKCIAPITNPSSEIDILLEDESLKENNEIEIVTETPLTKHSMVGLKKIKSTSNNDHYSRSKKDRTELLNGTPFPRSVFRRMTSQSYTANEVVRLQEKAQYKLLLDKVVKRSLYRPAEPKRKPTAIQVDLTKDEDLSLSYHFKKEKVYPINDFLTKCYKPCTLVPYSAKNYESRLSHQGTSSEDEKEDDEIQIIDSTKLPMLIPRKMTNNSYFSEAWINELQITINTETEKRLKIVAEQEEKIQRYKNRRDAKLAEEMRKREQQRLAGYIFPEDIEMEEDILPEITPEMEKRINEALEKTDPNHQLSSIDRLTLTRIDMTTLTNLNWLNDQVINFYMQLIAERSKLDNFPSVYNFNSFFYSSLKSRGESNVLRWTRRIDIFSFDIILVPLHLEMHWALLIVDNRNKKIKYFDSMGSGEERCLRIMQSYLICEMRDKKKTTMDPYAYSLEIPKDIPKQMNGSDCGMFTLKYAEYLSRDAPITFTQENMPYFRRRMIYELLEKQIL